MYNSNLIKALCKVQEKITNPPNTATNPFFKSKYAPLPEILKEIRPLLTKEGLVLIQNTGSELIYDNAANPYPHIFVKTILFHQSGESYETDKLYLKLDKKTPQGAGSAITYARRYQLTALLGISSEDDDDGNTASINKTNEKVEEDTPKKVKPKSGTKKRKVRRTKENTGKELDIKVLEKKPHIDTAIETLRVSGIQLNLEHILKELQDMLGEETITQDEFNQCKKELGLKV
jgi:hypothetical protein